MTWWGRWVWITAAGVVAVVVLGWYMRGRLQPSAVPPAVDTSGQEPESAEAIQAALAEVRSHPRSSVAWGELGMTLFAHHRDFECRPCFAEAERLDPRDPRWPYLQGVAAENSEKAAAMAPLQRAAALAERDPAVQTHVGEALLDAGGLAEAGEYFTRALNCDAGYPRALLGMGKVLLQQGNAQAALTYLQAVTDHPTTQKEAHARLADAYQQLGNADKANEEKLAAESLAADLRPFDAIQEQAWAHQRGREARLGQARAILAQGNPEDAVALLHETVQRYPESDEAFLLLGRAYIRLGQHADAEKALREANRLKPDAFDSVFLIGHTLFGQNQYEKAAEQFRAALRLRPNYGTAHYNLGQCLLQLGQKPEAVQEFEEAVRLEPANSQARQRLDELRTTKEPPGK